MLNAKSMISPNASMMTVELSATFVLSSRKIKSIGEPNFATSAYTKNTVTTIPMTVFTQLSAKEPFLSVKKDATVNIRRSA